YPARLDRVRLARPRGAVHLSLAEVPPRRLEGGPGPRSAAAEDPFDPDVLRGCPGDPLASRGPGRAGGLAGWPAVHLPRGARAGRGPAARGELRAHRHDTQRPRLDPG